jgi:flagellar protein FliJ
MKPRDTALRLKQFEADEKGRKVADLQAMIRDFENMASDLDRQIRAEEDRTGVRDASHFAYSTFAKSAAQRRDNLKASADELRTKLEAAQKERDEAVAQLNRVSNGEQRDDARARRRPDRPHAAMMR